MTWYFAANSNTEHVTIPELMLYLKFVRERESLKSRRYICGSEK